MLLLHSSTRKFYSKSVGWGRFCLSLPHEWIAEMNSYQQGFEGIEFIDTGGIELYLQPAVIRGRNPERDYEEYLMERREVRLAESRSPWIRKSVDGRVATLWYARTRRVGHENRTVVVQIPEPWVRKMSNGRALPKHVSLREEGGLLIVSLSRNDQSSKVAAAASDAFEPWYGSRVIPINVTDLRTKA